MTHGSDWNDYLLLKKKQKDIKTLNDAFKKSVEEKLIDLHLKRLSCFKPHAQLSRSASCQLSKAIVAALNYYAQMLFPHKVKESSFRNFVQSHCSYQCGYPSGS